MNDRSRWLVLAALGLLLVVLGNSHFAHFSPFHGGFRLFGFHPLLTAILLAAVIWFLLVRCGDRISPTTEPMHTAPMADVDPEASAGDEASEEHENEEDPDITG